MTDEQKIKNKDRAINLATWFVTKYKSEHMTTKLIDNLMPFIDSVKGAIDEKDTLTHEYIDDFTKTLVSYRKYARKYEYDRAREGNAVLEELYNTETEAI